MSYIPGERGKRVNLENKTLVRYNKKGKKLEIVVNPQEAWLYKQGEKIPIEDIIEGDIIFTNFSKGMKAGAAELEEILGTDNIDEAIKIILDEGELLLTQEQRKSFLKEKRKEIIDFLHTHCVNPKTGLPHPKQRLEQALDQVGVNIDFKRDAEEQALEILPKLRSILPLRMEIATVQFRVPPTLVGQLYGLITSKGKVVKEEWGNEGSWIVTLTMPAGAMADLMELVAERTKGKVNGQIIERKQK